MILGNWYKTAGSGEAKLLQHGKAEFTVHVNQETGTVKVVQFSQIPF